MSGSIGVNDPVRLALIARREIKRDPRQAAEKAYLAAVRAARQVVRALGGRYTDRHSASAIGRAAELIGKHYPGGQLRQVTRAFQRALGDHKACFYEGVCERTAITKDVSEIVRATKTVRRLFGR